MKKYLSLFTLIAILLSACSGDGNEEDKEMTAGELLKSQMVTKSDRRGIIDSLEAKLYADSTSINRKAAAHMIRAYGDFIENHPDDPETPQYAYKAGEVSMALDRGYESLKFFQQVVDEYPDYKRHSYALFMKAFVLENNLQDFERAEEAYREFLEKHPHHDLAKDAEYSLKNLGKSPEELIKEFEEKNKRNSAEKQDV